MPSLSKTYLYNSTLPRGCHVERQAKFCDRRMIGTAGREDIALDAEGVIAAFGLAGPVTGWAQVGGAWSNRVYRLEAGAGVFAVKEMVNPWGIEWWEQQLAESWSFELLAIGARVAAPPPVRNPATGGCLARVSDKSGTPVPVRVHRWVPGRPFTPEVVDTETARWVGNALAILHGLGVKARDRDLFPVPNVYTAIAWPELAEAAGKNGVEWAPLMKDASAAVASMADLVLSDGHRPAEEVMSHGDIDQKNLIATERGPVLCDWDVALPVVPRRELADVALSMGCWQDFGVAREVVRAYRASGGDDTDVTALDLGVPLMVGLDWVAFHVDRALGRRPASPVQVATAHELLPELLTAIPHGLETALRITDILRV